MNSETQRTLREEGMRGVAWLCLSFLGWSIIYTSMDRPAISAGETIGLVVVSTVVLIGVAVGIRLRTGLELKAGTEDENVLHFVGGGAVVGFMVLFLIFVRGYPGWWFAVYLVAVAAFGWMKLGDVTTDRS